MTDAMQLSSAGSDTMLARVATRPIAVCLQGSSLSRMAVAIGPLDRLGAIFCSVNDIGVVETHTAAVGRGIDIWFCSSESEFKRLSGSVSTFLERATPNLLVTFSTTLAHLDAKLALTLAETPSLTSRILLADSVATRIFERCPQRPVNSLTGLLSVLTLLGAQGPIVLLGCDGVQSDQTAFDAYDQPEKLAPHRLGTMGTLHQDMMAFHDNWPHLARHFERDLGLLVPAIWNCNPDSHYTLFPKMPWQEALAAVIRSPPQSAAPTPFGRRSAITLVDPGGQWPVRNVATLHAAINAFQCETTREYEWIQREALDPYFGWSLKPWPPYVIGLNPAAGPVDVATASWSTLDALRARSLCAIAGNVPTLKLQIADLIVRGLETDIRALKDSRGDLEGQLDAALQAIAHCDAAAGAHAERTWQLAGALARSRITRLAAEYRLHRLRVVLYPAGGHTRELLSTTALSEIPIVGIVDSSPARWGTAFLEHHVSPPEALEKLCPDVVVICSQSYENEIYDQLAWLRERGTATLRLYSTDPEIRLGDRSDALGNRVA